MAAENLSDKALRNLKHDGGKGHRVVAVGGCKGLSVQISATGSKSWLLRIVADGKRREIGLGPYPEISLAEARERGMTMRNAFERGENPLSERQAAKDALRIEREAVAEATEKCMTLAEAVRDFCSAGAAQLDGLSNTKHKAQWESTLLTYVVGETTPGRQAPRNRANPQGIGADGLGHLPVAEITKHDVARVLEPIWKTIPETARRVRGRLEAVIRWADGKEGRDRANPAQWSDLKHLGAFTERKSKKQAKIQAKKAHHPALEYRDAPGWFADISARSSISARALAFLALTAVRSQEVRGARWGEFSGLDGDKPVWEVPGERMKMGEAHRVPLSAAAVQILQRLPRHVGTDLVFVAPRGGALGDMALSKLMKDRHTAAVADGGRGWLDKDNGKVATPHGLRATFRTWVQEATTFPRELAEAALAHASGDAVERAYARGDALARRRELMQAWADYMTGAAVACEAAE